MAIWRRMVCYFNHTGFYIRKRWLDGISSDCSEPSIITFCSQIFARKFDENNIHLSHSIHVDSCICYFDSRNPRGKIENRKNKCTNYFMLPEIYMYININIFYFMMVFENNAINIFSYFQRNPLAAVIKYYNKYHLVALLFYM